MSFQLEVHSPDRPRFAVVERIAAFISARGSLAISLDLTRILQCVQKELGGSAAERNSFRMIVSWKDRSLPSCNIHESFQFLFLEMLLCILDGSGYMFLAACLDVIELFLSCCFVVALLLPFSR